jgi:hypothetical protein
MKYADLIVPRGRKIYSIHNNVAIDFIVSNLENKLIERGFNLQSKVP